MKKALIIIALLSIVLTAKAQMRQNHPYHQQHHAPDTLQPPYHRYGLWYTPVCHSTIVDGVGAGFFAGPAEKNETLTINGMSIEADPLPLLCATYWSAMVIVYIPRLIKEADKEKHDSAKMELKRRRDSIYHETGVWYPGKDSMLKVEINGVSISGGITATKTKMNGLAINAIWGNENQMNGLEVTGLINLHYSFQGLLIAPVNRVISGKGLQIGIYNNCKQGRVVQIGLLNKIGKRTIPFINFSFRRKKGRE